MNIWLIGAGPHACEYAGAKRFKENFHVVGRGADQLLHSKSLLAYQSLQLDYRKKLRLKVLIMRS